MEKVPDEFGEGTWLLDITDAPTLIVESKDLRITDPGLFITHHTDHGDRYSFVPWHRLKRAYTVNSGA